MPRRKAVPTSTTDTPTFDGTGDESTPIDGGAGTSSSAAAAAAAAASESSEATRNRIHKQMNYDGIESYELPKAVLARVAKAELPDNVQIRKDALLAISKSATIFISYLAAVSDELAKQNTRKSITPNDVVEGLSLMEFPEEIRTQLKKEIREFRNLEAQKKDAATARKAAASGGVGGSVQPDDDEEEEAEDAAGIEGGDESGATSAIGPAGPGTLVPEADDGQAAQEKDADLEQPPARPSGELDADEEDEDKEERMVEEGAQEGDQDMA